MRPWVQKVAAPLPKFNSGKEKETYQEARREVMTMEWPVIFPRHPKKCVPTHEPFKRKDTLVDEDPI